MKIKIGLILGCALLALSACDKKRVKVESENDKNLYYLGAKFGSGLATMKLTEEEVRVVSQGFTDAALNQKMDGFDSEDRPEKVEKFLESKQSNAVQSNEQQGNSFIEDFIAKGGLKTESGLVYQILAEGEGENPGPKDVVDINYEASLTDGKVYTSTKSSGQPTRYPLDKIIQGWAEGIRLIKPGGKIKLVIPPEIGYGSNGSPPHVPGGATVVMEVELLSVLKESDIKRN